MDREGLARAGRRAPVAVAAHGSAVGPRLGRRRRVARGARSRRCRSAGELPLQRRRKGKQRRAGEKNGGAVRRLCQRRVRHRASRGGHDARHRQIRAGRLRRPAAGGRARCAGKGAGASGTAAGGHRRRLQGIDQAVGADPSRGEGRHADRRRRHRQHVPARGRRPHRHFARGARPGRRGARHSRSISGQGSDADRRGRRQGIIARPRRRRSRRSRISPSTT